MERSLVAVARTVARVSRAYATAAALAALVVAAFLARDGLPDRLAERLVLAAAVALAAAPAVILWLLSTALGALADLPARVRELPAEGRGRRDELARLRESARRGRRLALPLVLWRLGRVAGSSRDLIRPHAGVLPLLSPPFLALSGLAAVAAAVEVAVAAVLLVVLAAR